jgi:hypothetical protein
MVSVQPYPLSVPAKSLSNPAPAQIVISGVVLGSVGRTVEAKAGITLSGAYPTHP